MYVDLHVYEQQFASPIIHKCTVVKYCNLLLDLTTEIIMAYKLL